MSSVTNRLNGVLDLLASSSETVDVAVHLILPFASPLLYVANFFVWWGLLFSVAWAIAKLLFSAAPPQEMAQKVALGAMIFLAFIPIQVTSGYYGRLPLASWITWQGASTVNQLFKNGVDGVLSTMTKNDSGLPLGLIHTLNDEQIKSINGTPLAPIVSDYVGNCTRAVTFQDSDGSPIAQREWRSVGLLGTGGLGFEVSDAASTEPSIVADKLTYIFSLGTLDLEKMHQATHDWESERSRVKKLLAKVEFPNEVRATGYQLPTSEYWRQQIDPDYRASGKSYESLSLPADSEFLPTASGYAYQNSGATTAGPKTWYADNCLELYYLAHRGTRSYLHALSDYYEVSMANLSTKLTPDQAKAAGGAALEQAMRSYYNRVANQAAGAGNGSAPALGSYTLTGADNDEGWGTAMGWIHELAAFLLNIGLDQAVLGLLGSMAVGIAFLVISFPIFAVLAPITGSSAIVIPLKIIIMLNLTLMVAYVSTAVGLELIAGLNVVATNSAMGAYSMSSASANLTVGVMTGMFLMPIIGGVISYMIVFGSMGVGAMEGLNVSLGKQAGLAYGMIRAAMSLSRVAPKEKAWRAAPGGSQGTSSNGGRLPPPTTTGPRLNGPSSGTGSGGRISNNRLALPSRRPVKK